MVDIQYTTAKNRREKKKERKKEERKKEEGKKKPQDENIMSALLRRAAITIYAVTCAFSLLKSTFMCACITTA